MVAGRFRCNPLRDPTRHCRCRGGWQWSAEPGRCDLQYSGARISKRLDQPLQTGPIAILALFSSVPERPLRERMDAITDRIARDSTSPILAAPSTYRAGDAR